MGIVMGTLVFGTPCFIPNMYISDIKGQSVGKFYIYWCNILTHKDDDYGQITVWERELRAF